MLNVNFPLVTEANLQCILISFDILKGEKMKKKLKLFILRIKYYFYSKLAFMDNGPIGGNNLVLSKLIIAKKYKIKEYE